MACSASSSRPLWPRSQRGLSGKKPCISSSTAAGSAASARYTGQNSREPRTAGSPATCAASMALPAVSWKSVPRVPRRCGSEISPRYMGTTTVVAPEAAPLMARPRTMSATPATGPRMGSARGGSALRASATAPRVKKAALMSSARRRPRASASEAPAVQPQRAPRQKTETQKPQRLSPLPGGRCRSARMAAAAVFMLPLLKPYCRAGSTATAAARSSGPVQPPWTLTTVSASSPSVNGWLSASKDLPTERLFVTREARPGWARGARSRSGEPWSSR
mmetsp:Transcript_59145/g.190234  ORF Transcript_59145/g.190234 Transcript_59145/m.190234 type:complete len:277 (-) Transcript_59145:173-1003(-)